MQPVRHCPHGRWRRRRQGDVQDLTSPSYIDSVVAIADAALLQRQAHQEGEAVHPQGRGENPLEYLTMEMNTVLVTRSRPAAPAALRSADRASRSTSPRSRSSTRRRSQTARRADGREMELGHRSPTARTIFDQRRRRSVREPDTDRRRSLPAERRRECRQARRESKDHVSGSPDVCVPRCLQRGDAQQTTATTGSRRAGHRRPSGSLAPRRRRGAAPARISRLDLAVAGEHDRARLGRRPHRAATMSEVRS